MAGVAAESIGRCLTRKGAFWLILECWECLCSLPVEKVAFELLEEDGGPLIWPRITEQEQNTFDASCRKLYRFLTTATDNDRNLS